MSAARSTAVTPAEGSAPRCRQAVVQAAVELLGEGGRDGFSIDAVSRRTGVARTTIYRHWPDVNALLVDAFEAAMPALPAPDTGDLEADLTGFYQSFGEALRSTDLGRTLPVLLDLARRDPSLRPIHQRFVRERRRPALTRLRAGLERGELAAGTDVESVLDQIAGPIFYRFLVVREPYDAAAIAALVRTVLGRALTPARRRSGRAQAGGHVVGDGDVP